MKIIITVLLAIITLGSFAKYTLSNTVRKPTSNFSGAMASSNTILKKDHEKFESHFNKETLTDKNWQNINNYSVNTTQLVNKKNSAQLFRLTNGSIANLESCLIKDFCGMEKRNENDAYFDENRTPGHILLVRYLEIMLQTLKISPELQNEIDWELINMLTENNNLNVQVLAFEFIKKYHSEKIDDENLFIIADSYKGDAKAEALAILSNRNTIKPHLLLINLLEKTFSSDDPHTVISVIEKINRMNLSKDDLEKISKNLCHYKENGIENPNWKMIKYDMKNIGINLDNFCS